MSQFKRVQFWGSQLPIILAVAFCSLQPATAKADRLTLSTEYLENGFALCSNSSTPASSCESAQAVGSLATGTLGVAAQIPQGLLPNMQNEKSVEAVASADLQYNFLVDVPSGAIATTLNGGTAVFTLSVDGMASVSNTLATVLGFAEFGQLPPTCSMTPCRAEASVGIPNGSGEAFAGLPGVQDYALANILNSGNVNGSTTLSISAPVNGGSVDFNVSLFALAECPSLTALEQASGESCSAVADYLDPLTITGASVYGANGNLIPGATLISQSGYSPTPEPSSILLLATGAALLGLRLKAKTVQTPL